MARVYVHELHPSLVHGPLALLPTAAVVDLVAALRGDRRLARTGCALWSGTFVAGLAAGIAGLAASQEVKADDKHVQDMMFLHGVGNVVVVCAALGMALWRRDHQPTLGSALLGLGASVAAGYTAWLGGEMVYGHGLGVKAKGRGVRDVPPLFSRQAPARLAIDAVRGLRWLLGRAGRVAARRERIDRGAAGLEPAPDVVH